MVGQKSLSNVVEEDEAIDDGRGGEEGVMRI